MDLVPSPQAIEAAVTAAVAEATAQAVHKTKKEVEEAQAQAAAAQADLRAAEDAQKVAQLAGQVDDLQQELVSANKQLQATTGALRYVGPFVVWNSSSLPLAPALLCIPNRESQPPRCLQPRAISWGAPVDWALTKSAS
jgi:hypothetical protein